MKAWEVHFLQKKGKVQKPGKHSINLNITFIAYRLILSFNKQKFLLVVEKVLLANFNLKSTGRTVNDVVFLRMFPIQEDDTDSEQETANPNQN